MGLKIIRTTPLQPLEKAGTRPQLKLLVCDHFYILYSLWERSALGVGGSSASCMNTGVISAASLRIKNSSAASAASGVRDSEEKNNQGIEGPSPRGHPRWMSHLQS